MKKTEELQCLRGIEIKHRPLIEDIPCEEFSDNAIFTCTPLVSVYVVSYNQEDYLPQALDGILSQQTDFSFEIVLGEDCSTDRTREICFEYQKRFPNKIRVLWSEENVFKFDGNLIRTFAHCRGRYIAMCEGDDWWIDPQKLQKQVDIMRQHPTVGFIFTGAKVFHQKENRYTDWNVNGIFAPGVISGKEFALKMGFGGNPFKGSHDEGFITTATTFFRRDLFERGAELHPPRNWLLYMDDATIWLSLAAQADCYYLKDQTAVYRVAGEGMCGMYGWRVPLDGALVRVFFADMIFGLKFDELPPRFTDNFFLFVIRVLSMEGSKALRKYFRNALGVSEIRRALLRPTCWPIAFCLALGWYSPFVEKWLARWHRNIPRFYLSAKYRAALESLEKDK